MSNIPTASQTSAAKTTAGSGFVRVMRFLKLILISGPKVLLTSQISIKCAAAMTMMCAPALLFSAILTLPAMVFQSPQQNAYFYFAKVLEQDPTRWIVLLLTGICAVLSLALPATMASPRDSAIF